MARELNPKFLEHRPCNLCRADDTVILARFDRVYDNNKYDIVRCKRCGLIYCDPMPILTKVESSKHVYNEDYYQHDMPYDENDSFITSLLKTSSEEQAAIVERYVRKGRFLEVGCGAGMFMDVMRRRGWQVWGTEISECATRMCQSKGLEVLNADLQELDFAPGYFDCVVLEYVIEHLNDPNGAVHRLSELISQGGLIVIATDNAEGFSGRIETIIRARLQMRMGKRIVRTIFGRYPRGFYGTMSPPVHLFYFSEKTLCSLLEKHGFEVIKVVRPPQGDKTYYPLAVKYRHNPQTAVFDLLDVVGGVFGRGRILVVYARKKPTGAQSYRRQQDGSHQLVA